jgi:hypothetical protein
MSTPLRLLAFAVLLVAVGLAGFGLGSVTGPVGPGGERGEPQGRPAGGPSVEGEHP